jgi:hypothetical protein
VGVERVEIGGHVLYRGDALAILPTLAVPENAAVLTDPPFGVRDDRWDLFDERSLCRFTMAWASAVRVPLAAVFHPSRYTRLFWNVFGDLFPTLRGLVWDKPLGSQYAGAAEMGMWYAHESVLVASHSVASAESATVAGLIRSMREAAGLSRGAVDRAVVGRRTGLCYRWEEGSCLPSAEHSRTLSH